MYILLTRNKLDALEDAVYQQGRTTDQPPPRICEESRIAAASLLQEGLELLLEKFNSPSTAKRSWSDPSDSIDPISRQVTQGIPRPPPHTIEVQVSNKRKRMNDSILVEPNDFTDVSSSLPPPEVLKAVIDTYFTLVQPWIPIFHEKRFRQRLKNSTERHRLEVILHAMIVAMLRHIDPRELSVNLGNVESICERSRKIVILTGMDDMYVENLQALIIVCFEDVRLSPIYSTPFYRLPVTYSEFSIY